MAKHQPRVCVINTGGTISMQRTSKGYVPVAGFMQEELASLSEFQHPDLPKYDVHEFDPLLDSSNMRPEDWRKMARHIVEHYDDYDGFVILHGTDTMSYTASALSFMLENLAKPVILTGSQIPLVEVRNDAQNNLLHALLIAANYAIPEVCIYFGNKLLRGNRTQKVDNAHFAAFDSPRFPPLGISGIEIMINFDSILPMPKNKKIQLNEITQSNVSNFRLFPGMSIAILKNVMQEPLRGLILETYGTGNAPNNDPAFLKVLKEASDRGVVIVNCTQCLRGSVNMESYATGAALKNIAVNGYDMTPEAAFTKLCYLLSQDLSTAKIKELMQQNLRGELSNDDKLIQ